MKVKLKEQELYVITAYFISIIAGYENYISWFNCEVLFLSRVIYTDCS